MAGGGGGTVDARLGDLELCGEGASEQQVAGAPGALLTSSEFPGTARPPGWCECCPRPPAAPSLAETCGWRKGQRGRQPCSAALHPQPGHSLSRAPRPAGRPPPGREARRDGSLATCKPWQAPPSRSLGKRALPSSVPNFLPFLPSTVSFF